MTKRIKTITHRSTLRVLHLTLLGSLTVIGPILAADATAAGDTDHAHADHAHAVPAKLVEIV